MYSFRKGTISAYFHMLRSLPVLGAPRRCQKIEKRLWYRFTI